MNRWSLESVTETANVRLRLLIPLAALLVGCGSDEPTRPPFGAELTVAEQVAVEATFGRFANLLDTAVTTPDDSVLADFTRVASRLVRLQGRYDLIAVLLPGSATRVPMRAVAVTSSDPISSAKLVLAWEDLNVATFQAKRLLVMQSGGFLSFLTAQVRYLDMTGATPVLYAGGGKLTFTAPSFTNSCAGLSNTATETCRVGKVTAAGEAQVTPPGGGALTRLNWAPTAISGFELKLQ